MISKLIYFSLFSFFFSCSERPSNKFIEISGKTMGTTYNVKFSPVQNYSPKNVSEEIEKILIDFNRICSTYIPDSEISIINRPEKFSGRISTEFKNLYLAGVRFNEDTQKEFDPSIGPLVNLWGFGPIKKTTSPSLNEIKIARSRSGLDNFFFDGTNLIKKNSRSYLDFSAFAKGRGVDLVFNYLKSIGATEIYVEIGGEIRVAGSNKTWRLGIESPNSLNKRNALKIISLKKGGLATSGDYRNFFIDNKGKKKSHGISFKTGSPKENLTASVTVYSNLDCMTADAWATALMVSDFEKAKNLAESEGIAAYFIYKSNINDTNYVIHKSSAWTSTFEKGDI